MPKCHQLLSSTKEVQMLLSLTAASSLTAPATSQKSAQKAASPAGRKIRKMGRCFICLKPERTSSSRCVTGADYSWRVVTGKTEMPAHGLVAIETRFGWAVRGPAAMSSINEAPCMHMGLSDDSGK